MTARDYDGAAVFAAINDYYANKPDFSQYNNQTLKDEAPAEELEKIQLSAHSPYPSKDNMPVHPAEEHAGGNITDQVAKDSSDSTASTHPHHQGDTGATSGGSIGAMAHKAHPGPVMADDIGKPASKEELKKRAEELNK